MIPQFSSALLDTQSSHTQVKLGPLIKKKKNVCECLWPLFSTTYTSWPLLVHV